MEHRFPKRMRLRKRREFLAVQNSDDGRKVHGAHFLIIVTPMTTCLREPDDVGGRLGITVSKRVGNAVTRNRIKRWVREFARQHPGWLPAEREVVVIAKRKAAKLGGYGSVAAELSKIEGQLASC